MFLLNEKKTQYESYENTLPTKRKRKVFMDMLSIGSLRRLFEPLNPSNEPNMFVGQT